MKRIALLACLAILAACKPAPQPAESEPKPAATPAPTATTLPDPGTKPEAAGVEYPQLKVQTLDGKSYELAAHRGKWVVLNFWATWCSPCLKEMPELSALDAMRSHIEVIGLAYEEIEPTDMQAFLRKHPVVYPIAIVDVYDPPKDFETPQGLPMTYLIAPDGRVVNRFMGPVSARDLEQAIAKAGGPAMPTDDGHDA